MAEIVSQDPTLLHDDHDDLDNGNGEPRGVKRARTSAAADDDDDDDDKPGRERRKIEIKFIQDKSRRHITFSKRKAGIMKKVRQASILRRDRRVSADEFLGVRAVRPDRDSSAPTRRVRDRPGLYLHHTQAAAIGHQARGQEPHPSEHTRGKPHQPSH